MPRYYFHLENGRILHDDVGCELRDMAAAQNEVLRVSGELMRSGPASIASLWKGTSWRVWVTDKPNGEGKTFFTLHFSAEI